MKYVVKLSQIANRDEFEKAVAEHVTRLNVSTKEKQKPRPTSSPLVEGAIKRRVVVGKPDEYYSDYEVDDDLPVETQPSLEDKKIAYQAVIKRAEKEARERILPERRVRLFYLNRAEALEKPENERNAEERETVASFARIMTVFRGIEKIAAQAESDLDDFTEDNIDSWQPPTFG